MPTIYRVPCSLCGVTVKAETYIGPKFCGASCEYLHVRRQLAEGVPPGHLEYHPMNDTQAGLHRQGLRKRGLTR